MTSASRDPKRNNERRQFGHYGAARALASAPAVVGSCGLLLVLSAIAGPWGWLGILGWVGAGVLLVARVGERVAVRVACGFRRPTDLQWETVSAAWADALTTAGLHGRDIDLYVHPARDLNAFAAGRRSVAISAGALDRRRRGHLDRDQLVALLVHELGHHRTGATGWRLTATFLAAPWRLVYRSVLACATLLGRRRAPSSVLALCAIVGSAVAVFQQTAQGRLAVAAALSGLLGCSLGAPLADAIMSRRSELAADAFAARAGLGEHLARVLLEMPDAPHRGILGRLLARHPSIEARVLLLARAGASAR